ncbi:MAG: hypothetical protein LKK08_03940 [Bacteroidales bacterium]|jgi:hypothetical protein|nr:hypothetical protein [Bacteroidales bacterium]MCI2145382.1 hypothetical protein [Bacteroidales bacterium]
MRGEIEGKESSRMALPFVAVCFFCVFFNVAQTDAQIPEAIGRLAEQIAEEGGAETAAECLEYYEELFENPLNINATCESELERLMLLSEFQIRSLLEYVEEYGAILSESELCLVSGFDAALVGLLRPFISFGKKEERGNAHKGLRHDAMLRTDRKFAPASGEYGLPVTLTGKYSVDDGNLWNAGISVRHNAFDTLRKGLIPSFTSAGVSFHDIPLSSRSVRKGRKKTSPSLDKIVVGDFTARFGQGLSIWKAFPVNFLSNPSSLCKSANGLNRYNSTSEGNFLRGVGGTVSAGRWSASLWASHSLAGTNLTITSGRIRIGATFCIYGKDSTVTSIDIFCTLGKGWRIFGEAALSHTVIPTPAALTGFIYSPSYEFEAAILMRSYSTSYDAPDGGAYSTLSKCKNQQGITAALLWRPSKWKIHFSCDAVHHPGPRYGIDTPSTVIKTRFDAELALGKETDLSFRTTYSYKTATEEHKAGIRIQSANRLLPCITLISKVEGCSIWNPAPELGFIAHEEVAIKLVDDRLSIRARLAYYSTTSWNTRIYSYEYDLPHTFSIPVFHDSGLYCYGLASYRTGSGISVWIKASSRLCRLGIILRI